MADVMEVERTPDGAKRSFSVDQIGDGTLYDWVTKEDVNADGRVTQILDLSGNNQNLTPTTNNRPYIVKNGYLQVENGRPSMFFQDRGEYYTRSIPSSSGRTIALRARPKYRNARQVLIDADGLRVVANQGNIIAEVQNGNGDSVSESYVVSPKPESTRIVAACDGSTVAIHVEGSSSTATYSAARTKDGQLSVGYETDENGLTGTIQQMYIWDEFKSSTKRDEILTRLDISPGTIDSPVEPPLPVPWSWKDDDLIESSVINQKIWKERGITDDVGEGKVPAFLVRANRFIFA